MYFCYKMKLGTYLEKIIIAYMYVSFRTNQIILGTRVLLQKNSKDKFKMANMIKNYDSNQIQLPNTTILMHAAIIDTEFFTVYKIATPTHCCCHSLQLSRVAMLVCSVNPFLQHSLTPAHFYSYKMQLPHTALACSKSGGTPERRIF